jgi:hypothetical protein
VALRVAIGTAGDCPGTAETILISLIIQRSQVRIRWIIPRTLRPPTVDFPPCNQAMINVARFVARNIVDWC